MNELPWKKLRAIFVLTNTLSGNTNTFAHTHTLRRFIWLIRCVCVCACHILWSMSFCSASMLSTSMYVQTPHTNEYCRIERANGVHNTACECCTETQNKHKIPTYNRWMTLSSSSLLKRKKQRNVLSSKTEICANSIFLSCRSLGVHAFCMLLFKPFKLGTSKCFNKKVINLRFFLKKYSCFFYFILFIFLVTCMTQTSFFKAFP